MHRLSYKIYQPQASTVAAAASTRVLSPVPRIHVVVMHGLLGCYRNWHTVCTTLATQPTATVAEGSGGTNRFDVQCVAFDWRNHGDSAHMEHSLDGLADDVQDFLGDYALSQLHSSTEHSCVSDLHTENAGQKSAEVASAAHEPIDVVLMGHSMGGMGMMHFLWDRHRQHIETCGADFKKGGTTPPLQNPFFCNSKYRIVGAVAVDIAPAARPESFAAMITAVCFLRKLPLEHMTSYGEMEEWLLANGPKPYYTKANIWMIRYFLSNVDVAGRRWKVGMEEIIDGTSKIRWPHDNTVAGCGGAVYPLIKDFPIQFVFGGASPYYNARGLDAIPNYFKDHEVAVVAGASHFLFMEQRKKFCEYVRGFLENKVLSKCGSNL
jgi:pimeloyl-ACP methyl ester carboxylesterase